MEQLRRIIASNISSLRLNAGLTQQELANKLNYTDKAVSKWERGESVPDISGLAAVASIFGVTVDYLINDHRNEKETAPDAQASRSAQIVRSEGESSEQSTIAKFSSIFGFKSTGKFTITLMAAVAVWLVAVIVFVILKTFIPDYGKSWLCFVFAIPATSITLLIFNILWGSTKNSFALMAVCIWTIIGSVFTFFIEFQPWILFLIAIPAQLIIILWQMLHNRKKDV